MAFIRVNEMECKKKDLREQEPAKATYTVDKIGGRFFFQIETYGRSYRENPDKASQTIQFDSDGIRSLISLMEKEMPSLFEKQSSGLDKKSIEDLQLVSNLHTKNQHKGLSPLILYGPPGTGKTYKMQHDYIDKFSNDDRFVTTFHQSFSYEEFVEGLKPVLTPSQNADGKSADVKYEIQKGVFYKACERAAVLAGFNSLEECVKASADDKEQKMSKAIKSNKIVLLCIDEINRANVSAVFGDLISLIEPSKRIGEKNEMTVTLPYSKKVFAVPANLMIVGTMNTADRSIQLLDSALRRRFRFEELLPDYNKIANEKARAILKSVNNRIRGLLDKDHQIGHSYFIGKNSDLEILKVMKENIIPLLEEYFYNETDKIRRVLNETEELENASSHSDDYFYVLDDDAKKAVGGTDDFNDEKLYYKLNDAVKDNLTEQTATNFLGHLEQ